MTNKHMLKTFLFLTQSLYVSSVLICSHPNHLGSSGQLICTGGSLTHSYTNPSGYPVAVCTLSTGLCDTRNVSASGINATQSVLHISRVEATDAGEWSCTAGLTGSFKCVFSVVKTPTCNITSKQDTNSLAQYQQLILVVDVQDYYCSTAHNVSLQTGNVTTLLTAADSVPSVSDNTSSVTLNVTDFHLGAVGLVFTCDSSQWNIECAGVNELAVPRTPTCAITSDKDTGTLILHEEVTLTVDVTSYYDVRGSYCSADSNFTLQTGDVLLLLHAGDQDFSPISFRVTETHLGGVRLIFNCHIQHWNLSCDGVTQISKRIDSPSTTLIIVVAVGATLVLIVLAIAISIVVQRKVSESAVHHTSGGTMDQAVDTVAVDSGGNAPDVEYPHPEARGDYMALDRNAVQPSNIYEHLTTYEQISNM